MSEWVNTLVRLLIMDKVWNSVRGGGGLIPFGLDSKLHVLLDDHGLK